MTLDVGREVDRYVVDRLLGEGGMAAVYRVKHARLGTWHALKVLTHTSRPVRDRLILEGKVQATMRHPNLVAVSDVLEIDNQPALLMEYVDGPSLERLLGSYKPDPTEALALFRGVLEGVRHAHARGLLHRDLKPANVLLQTADGVLVPKVADFGLAKLVSNDNQTKTRTGTTMGTPAYMSPEQIRNAAGVDARADVFSLGCLLYELVTGGQRTFVQEDLIALYEATSKRQYAPVRDLVPDVDPRVEAVIAEALGPTLDERLVSTDQMFVLLYGPGGPGADAGLDPDGPLGECARMLAVQARSGTGGADVSTWSTRAAPDLPSPPTLAPPAPELPSQELLDLRRRTRFAVGGAVAVALAALLAIGLAVAVLAVAVGSLTRPASPPELAPAVPAPVAVEAAPTPVPAPALAPAEAPLSPKPSADGPKPPIVTTRPAVTAPSIVTAPPVVAAPPVPAPPVATPTPPDDDPGPAAATTARVRVEGDAKLVRLVSGALAVQPGPRVPAGTWDVRAVFDGDAEVAAGRITVVAGDDVTRKCVAQLAKCVARR